MLDVESAQGALLQGADLVLSGRARRRWRVEVAWRVIARILHDGDVIGTPVVAGGQREWSRMLRDPCLPGIEVLQAHYMQYRYAPHWHEAVCVGMVDDGAAAFDCGGSEHVAQVGSVFAIPAFELHTGEPAARAGLGYRALYVDSDRLGDLLCDTGLPGNAELTPASPRDVVRHRARATGALQRFHRAMSRPASPLEREQALLGAVVSVATEFGALQHGCGVPHEHRSVRRAREYLHSFPAQDITLRELAEVSGLSMYRLAHTFKAETGLAPHAYQVQLRVLLAKRLLAAGCSIAEAAAECGFYDQAHLTDHFKRHVGVTPGVYTRDTIGCSE